MKILAYGADMTIMQPIKIAAISDMHGQLPIVPQCDILLIAGDICPTINHELFFQASWLDTNFREWLNEVPATEIVGIAGNHDFIFQYAPNRIPKDLNWVYLEDTNHVSEKFGVKIHGTPWQPFFYSWAFNAPEIDGEDFLAERFSLIDGDTDIVICHGPPFGYGDWVGRGNNVGSKAMLKKLQKVQPKLMVCGHIHAGHGQYVMKETKTIIANVSIVNEKYKPVYPPAEFELVFDEKNKI